MIEVTEQGDSGSSLNYYDRYFFLQYLEEDISNILFGGAVKQKHTKTSQSDLARVRFCFRNATNPIHHSEHIYWVFTNATGYC